MTNEEIWKDIEGYEELYQVSNLGRVKSLNYDGTRNEQILKPWKSKGYLQVKLYKNGEKYRPQVHRLVASAFIPNPDNLSQVNHKDENKDNNRVENLEWCDARYNSNYGTRIERISAKLINHKKLSIPVLCVETGKVFPSSHEAERLIGVNHSSITKCCNGRYGYKTAGGYHWQYAK